MHAEAARAKSEERAREERKDKIRFVILSYNYTARVKVMENIQFKCLYDFVLFSQVLCLSSTY